MDFGTLKTRIEAIIGRAPADVCYELVTADINHELRLSCMEKTTTLTEAASIALPADFLQVVTVYRDTDPRHALAPTSAQNIHRTYMQSGIPAEYAIVDDSGTKAMLLNPTPSGSESIELRYYAKFEDLSADGDTNDILTNYPGVYVYGALTHHAMLIRDMNALDGWSRAYGKEMGRAKQDDISNKYGGGPLTVKARATA